jgi:hypothetical protein
MRRLTLETACVTVASLGLMSCKVDPLTSGTSTTGTVTGTAATVGLWTGTDSASGDGVTAIINSTGQAVFIRSDGVQFTGSVQATGGAIAATLDGYTNFNATFTDGSDYGVGTLNGTVTAASAITATLSFTTSGGTAASGSWSLTYASLSGSGSSLSQISGNYTDNTTGGTVSINASGAMTSQNPTNGCVLNGTLSTTDTTYDVYQVSYTLEDCVGADAALNGVQFTGLAFYNGTVSPVQMELAVTGTASTSDYGLVSNLTAT